jgi:Cobalamin synthesis protein cobW C-terminal domain
MRFTTQAQQTMDGGKAMAVPPERWPQDAESVALIRAKWDDRVGDARQELVLIGMDMDGAALRARFDTCLLTDEEMVQGPRCGQPGTTRFPTGPDITVLPML